jgi:predicted metal-dependent hydrolase
MRRSTVETITLKGRRLDYRVVRSKAGKKLRVRVGPSGVEVIQPMTRGAQEIHSFLFENANWISAQVDRVRQLHSVIAPASRRDGEILFRGEPTRVRVERDTLRRGPNQVRFDKQEFVIVCGGSQTPPARSLENWLRREARARIEKHLQDVIRRTKRSPKQVYVMGQRTKWGNCSALGNLSFNWRAVMAPDSVMKYLVTHEAVHLVVPDHSQRFWLTVSSLCPGAERARQWLAGNGHRLMIDLTEVIPIAPARDGKGRPSHRTPRHDHTQ